MIADWDIDGIFLADLLKDRHPRLFMRLRSILIEHGVDVRLLRGVRDVWAKDYSPIQVGTRGFVHFRYQPDYLKGHPGLRTGRGVAEPFRDLGACRASRINLDGGNVVATRIKAILTNKIFRENPGWRRAELRNALRRLLQIDQLVLIPREPYDLIGHADAMVRFVDDGAVLINDYSKVDCQFGERLKDVLHCHRLAVETVPYFFVRQSQDGIPSAVGCYTNFLRTKHVLIAPSYGHEYDEEALNKLRAVFPSLPVLSLECTRLAQEGGVLNCIAAGFRDFR